MKLIECVPNFSEGRNITSITAISEALNSTPGVSLLNIDPDEDYNRTVFTFIGDEISIINGAVNACKAAALHIDMKLHKGIHPRLGAIDVVPFVPVRNSSMEECIRVSGLFGKRISEELDVPVYLYEKAAKHPGRNLLSDIRRGEYEGLEKKLLDPDWLPDFGKAKFNPKLGAIVTGARNFLIAFNVSLKTDDVSAAKKIAGSIRESGVIKKDIYGKPVKIEGESGHSGGKLKYVRAIGVKLKRHGFTQVSMNLVNYKETPPHTAFEKIKKEAARYDVEIIGSEVVGMIPLEALLMAGNFYSTDKNRSEEELINIAIEKLGLNKLKPFNPDDKIIDYFIN